MAQTKDQRRATAQERALRAQQALTLPVWAGDEAAQEAILVEAAKTGISALGLDYLRQVRRLPLPQRQTLRRARAILLFRREQELVGEKHNLQIAIKGLEEDMKDRFYPSTREEAQLIALFWRDLSCVNCGQQLVQGQALILPAAVILEKMVRSGAEEPRQGDFWHRFAGVVDLDALRASAFCAACAAKARVILETEFLNDPFEANRRLHPPQHTLNGWAKPALKRMQDGEKADFDRRLAVKKQEASKLCQQLAKTEEALESCRLAFAEAVNTVEDASRATSQQADSGKGGLRGLVLGLGESPATGINAASRELAKLAAAGGRG